VRFTCPFGWTATTSVAPSSRQFWVLHGHTGRRRTGTRPSARARFQTDRASRNAWFLTALGRAAVKSAVVVALPSSGSTPLSRAATSTLLVPMYSWAWARNSAACPSVGSRRMGTVVCSGAVSLLLNYSRQWPEQRRALRGHSSPGSSRGAFWPPFCNKHAGDHVLNDTGP
jgi:hypothetical protein